MNYLAHIFLSGDNNEVKIGNFIADFVPGKKYKNYSSDIQKGIILHRNIDTYTDAHQIFRQSKKRLFSDFRHYSAVIVDMFYDHFLAVHFNNYTDQRLEHFVAEFYILLNNHKSSLPPKVRHILPIMEKYNWLLSYRDLDKLKQILNQMNNRTKHQTNLHDSIDFLKRDYSLYQEDFKLFFEDMLDAKTEMHKNLKIN